VLLARGASEGAGQTAAAAGEDLYVFIDTPKTFCTELKVDEETAVTEVSKVKVLPEMPVTWWMPSKLFGVPRILTLSPFVR